MTAQPSTQILHSSDFTTSLRNSISDSHDCTNTRSSSQSVTTNDKNENENNSNSNSNCFNSEDFQRFLNEHRDTLETPGATASSSLDQLFKTSDFFKSHQFSDLFKSQQSFSQMFQSKDSFAELFQSLDSDQKKAFFSSDADKKDPLSPPVFPAMDSMSRVSSSKLLQSKDWLNLGSHVDVNYQQSKLFRDTSSSYGSIDANGDAIDNDNDEPMLIHAPTPAQPQQPTEEASSKPKTDWGDVFFAQLQPSAAVPPLNTLPSSAAPVVPPPKTLPPVPLPKKKRPAAAKTTAATRKQQQGKRYIANPTETDILMGRGGKSNHHPGNKRYREEILNFKNTYSQLTCKEEKTGLSRHVVDYVHKYNGRFLALDKTIKPSRWYEITDAVARRKVSQALREDGDPVKRQEKRARFLERKRQNEEDARRKRQLL
ncbi:unnamed protein product [Cylindrotheca closterium]|uniref:DUF6824 domain-containing protein n=1 Tax=Cylindrotheca closterium TaxID=2856 RepID=A0AAD2FSK3_9STRA|nr:unnamed protein product [Cylindrotheca closterium]